MKTIQATTAHLPQRNPDGTYTLNGEVYKDLFAALAAKRTAEAKGTGTSVAGQKQTR